MSQGPPTTLGKYQIIREIARSNDIVYEAYDPMMNRRVALKELNAPTGASASQVEDRVNRFRREAHAVGTLAHPNIMTVYEYGQDGDRHFMAMEYLDGHTLRNEIDTKGFLSPDETVEILTAVLRGLAHAHSKGVIHRDIKPDNIQILSSGEVKITDFGIARLTFQPNLTIDGQVFGTPSYMSPEQVVGKELDQRSDIFSVGVLLYEMLTGVKPFTGDSVFTITHAIMNNQPVMLPQIPQRFQDVVAASLQKTPALRYADAQTMIDALEKAAAPAPAAPDFGVPNYGSFGPSMPQPPDPYAQYTPYGTPNPNLVPPPVLLPPQYNPYASPVAPPPILTPPATPPTYPYNPYAGGQPQAPHTTSPQFPIYYPPPPRQPLLGPESKMAIAKFFMIFLLIGSIVAAAILVITYFGRSDITARRKSRPVPVNASAQSRPSGTSATENRAAGIQPAATPSMQPYVPSEPPSDSVEAIRARFARLKRDKPVPDRAALSDAMELFVQLEERDRDLAGEIAAYINQGNPNAPDAPF
jgi:serine/threonine-protein kinase